MKKYDLVIIGAGSGGLSAAAGAAKLGLKVLLVEKNKLGGDCLWHGCIPSKTLIHEADKMRVIREESIDVDFSQHFEEAKKRIKKVQEAIGEHDSKARFESLGCDVILGEAKFVSKNKIEIFDNQNVSLKNFKFKKCIVATGSRPMVPEIFKSVRFYTNESIFDVETLPQTMTIIGGGSIGVEIASAFAMFGTKIKMILKEDRVMPREEENVGEFIKIKMQSLGIEMYNHTDVKDVYERAVNGQNLVHVDVGNGVILQSEVLFVATGRLFNSDLNLKNAKIETGERNEILINNFLQTTNKKVYAIGDVNGFRLFTHAAGYQAKAALQNIIVPSFFGLNFVSNLFKKRSIPDAFPWVTYTYPEVAHVGAYKKDLENKRIFFKSYKTDLESVDRARTSKINKEGYIEVIVGKFGFWKGYKNGKILGVTIVSPHAGELITEWVLAMNNNLPVESIFDTIHAYPTLSELNPRGTFEYMSEKLTPFKSKLLKFLFKI